MNNKIVSSTKITSAIFLAIVLVAGTITLFSPSFIVEAQAEPYGMDDIYGYSDYRDDKDKKYDSYGPPVYGMDSSYDDKKSYGKDDSRDKSIKDSKKSVSINKLKCINTNLNINGNNTGDVSIGNKGGIAEAGYLGTYSSNGDGYSGGDDGYGKQGKGFDCIINNNNNNTVVGEEPIPSTTASLTVKKQVFGCDNFDSIDMDCDFQNNSEEWLDCNNSPISGTIFCQSLPESIFDIEVLDDHNAQIQQFEGSEQGTTVQNLEPGTYTVNEMKQDGNLDTLGILESAEEFCVNEAGFSDGGDLFNTTSSKYYNPICFEYEDEQGNDCSTITLAAGEERTCTVKNYIVKALGN